MPKTYEEIINETMETLTSTIAIKKMELIEKMRKNKISSTITHLEQYKEAIEEGYQIPKKLTIQLIEITIETIKEMENERLKKNTD